MGNVWDICPLLAFSAVARTFALFAVHIRACAGETAIIRRMANDHDSGYKFLFSSQDPFREVHVKVGLSDTTGSQQFFVSAKKGCQNIRTVSPISVA
jgi:hypothetical protein